MLRCLNACFARICTTKIALGEEFNGAVTYFRIRVTDGERTKKMQNDERRLGGDDGLRGTCKERIKCMSTAH